MFCTLTKCCFCFPLRSGLIAFGYIMSLICYINLVSMMCIMNDLFQENSRTNPMSYILFSLAFAITAVQLIFHVIMLFGLHKNSAELLGAYYECNICMFATQVIVSSFYIPLQTYRYYPILYSSVWKFTLGLILVAAISISIQFYLVSLVRSHLRKLRRANDEENAISTLPLNSLPVAGTSNIRENT